MPEPHEPGCNKSVHDPELGSCTCSHSEWKPTREEARQTAEFMILRHKIKIDLEILATVIYEVEAHAYNDGWDDCMEAIEREKRDVR